MTLQFFELVTHPNQIAVSKIGSVAENGAFFLDFSRPIEILRWFVVPNRWFGLAIALFVPVIHQGQKQGEFVIGVHRSEPQFADLRALWKTHYPSSRTLPTTEADGFQIIADFAAQFPEDCQTPPS
jgi:hypothetical protein